MNKKFLSAILFGALMVTSTGTFVSCKDYDDDIENLQGQISANSSAIAELKSLVQGSDYVTAVAINGNNLVVTTKNGSSQTLALPEHEDKVGSLCEVVGGVLYIDGVATDIKVCEGTTEEGEFLPAVTILNGEWAVLQEDNTYKSTGVEVSSVAVSGSKAAGYVLTVKDAEGNETVIELPTAASKITNLSLGNEPEGGWVVSLSDYDTWTTSGVIDAASKWKGPKTLPANGSKVYVNTVEHLLQMRIDPVGIDATELEFTLVSARNQINPSFKMVASEDILYRDWTDADVNGRAAYGNGLYTLDVKKFVVSGGQFAVEDFETEYADNMRKAYAVTANGSYRSEYTVDVVALAGGPELEYLYVSKAIEGPEEGYTELEATEDNEWTVKVGTTNQINFNSNKAMYDMYMTVEDKYIEPFGITWDDAARTFKVSKNPDSSSLKAGFPMNIYAVDNEGLVTKTTIQVKLSTIISSNYVYEAQSHDVSSYYNYFVIDLDDMKESISSDLAAWKLNVDLSKTEIQVFANINGSNEPYNLVYPSDEDEFVSAIGETAGLFNYQFASVIKNDYTGVTGNADNAKYIQVAVTNGQADDYEMVLDKTYYGKIVFNDAEGNELNTIIVPVKFTAPALADLFTQKSAYVKDGVINAYFYKVDETTYPTAAERKTVDLPEYFSKYVADAQVDYDNSAKVGATDKYTGTLAIGATTYDEDGEIEDQVFFGDYDDDTDVEPAAIGLNTDVTKAWPNNQFELGYNEVLTFKISKDNYAGWTYPVNRDGSCPNGVYGFKMRIMSSIIEGSIAPATGSSIEISASDATVGAKITSDMIKGTDYNKNKYNVVPDMALVGTDQWSNPYVSLVEPLQDADQLLLGNPEVKGVTVDDDGEVTALGYFVVKAKSISNTTTVQMPVRVTDAWGYKKTQDVPVKIKMN